jgi:hypothetical protein
MKSKSSYILLLILSVYFTSCEKKLKEPKGSGNASSIPALVKLKASFNYEGNALLLNQVVNDQLGRAIKIELFKFYLSNIYLHSTNGGTVKVEDVLLFNFNNSTNTEFLLKTSVGNYNAISFGIGLDAQQNTSDPSTFAASHPLSVLQNTYWTWATKYRFIMLDGKGDGNNDSNLDDLFSYHAGDDLLYSIAQFNLSTFQVKSNAISTIEIKIDLDKVFFGINGTIDFVSESSTHSTNPTAFKFAGNFADALSVSVY